MKFEKLAADAAGTWVSGCSNVAVAAGATTSIPVVPHDGPFVAVAVAVSTRPEDVPLLSVTVRAVRETLASRVPASAFYARVDAEGEDAEEGEEGDPIDRGGVLSHAVSLFPSCPLVVEVNNGNGHPVTVSVAMFGEYVTSWTAPGTLTPAGTGTTSALP